jgi:adenosylhomocysteine nucleosidase
LSTLLRAAAHEGLARLARETGAPNGVTGHTVHQGLIASGDRFVSAADESRVLHETLTRAGHAALAVEMEGAAVAQVCFDYGVPFAAMRTISDRADDTAHVDFPKFVSEVASRYALAIMSGLMLQLAKR